MKNGLDDDPVLEAMKLAATKTQKEVIHLGLRELVRAARLRNARDYRGAFQWQGDLEEMRVSEPCAWCRSRPIQ